MNNLNKNQKIAIVIITIVAIGSIYFLLYTKENNEISDIQNNEIETIDNKDLTNKSETEEQKETIKIHISGAVNKEGLIELEENSLINDAIEKAGGLKENAYIDDINLAFPLEDGMKIYIPNINEKQQTEQQENSQNSYISKDSGTYTINNTNTLQSNTKTEKININTANQSELESLPGIGPSTATKIINYRNENGKFKSIEDLKEVSGIGESKFNKIKELICVK